MKHEVATLEGALLDEAVAKAEGWKCEGNAWSIMHSATSGQVFYGDVFPFSWSTDWKCGGPIIERERIALVHVSKPDLYDEFGDRPAWPETWQARIGARALERGHTPLIAAMRAYVASKFGATVEL
jgi:hypothetical protein